MYIFFFVLSFFFFLSFFFIDVFRFDTFRYSVSFFYSIFYSERRERIFFIFFIFYDLLSSYFFSSYRLTLLLPRCFVIRIRVTKHVRHLINDVTRTVSMRHSMRNCPWEILRITNPLTFFISY